MTINPYATPAEMPANTDVQLAGPDVLASRVTRFAAAMIDGFLVMAIVIPYQIFSGFNQKAMSGSLTIPDQLSLSVVQICALLLLNGYLIISRGQSIGKLVLKIQIVDVRTHMIPPWHRVLLIRQFWLYPLSLLVVLIPGTVDDFLLVVVPFIDSLFIFRKDHRCIHDLLAGTIVVQHRSARQPIHAAIAS